jgi:hypothetical protein
VTILLTGFATVTCGGGGGEKPNAAMKKNVPMSDTGMATIGMTAARRAAGLLLV